MDGEDRKCLASTPQLGPFPLSTLSTEKEKSCPALFHSIASSHGATSVKARAYSIQNRSSPFRQKTQRKPVCRRPCVSVTAGYGDPGRGCAAQDVGMMGMGEARRTQAHTHAPHTFLRKSVGRVGMGKVKEYQVVAGMA